MISMLVSKGAFSLPGIPFALFLKSRVLTLELPDVQVSKHCLLGCFGKAPFPVVFVILFVASICVQSQHAPV